jgi:hypothetical protein
MGISIDSNILHTLFVHDVPAAHIIVLQTANRGAFVLALPANNKRPLHMRSRCERVVDYALKSSFARTLTLWAGICVALHPYNTLFLYPRIYIIYKELVVS